jgi:MFS family permease
VRTLAASWSTLNGFCSNAIGCGALACICKRRHPRGVIHLPAVSVFQHRDFRLYWLARVASIFAVQMQAIAIAWLVYDRARETHDVQQSAFILGMVGLAQFVPIGVLSLFAGQAADRFDRRKIILWCFAGEAVCGVALTAYVLSGMRELWPVFAVAAFFGGVRAFMMPAQQSIVVTLVPREALPTAISWNSMAMQVATITGPVGAGYLLASAMWAPFAAMSVLLLLAIVFIAMIGPRPHEAPAVGRSLALIAEGFAYLGKNKIVLGAISLDLAAVLLGSATAMLPVYARDILHIGEDGLGHLRAAPAVGAVIVAFTLAAAPIRRHVGLWMFAGVFVFGFATIAFGLSKTFWPAFTALAVLGAGDMLSVYVRQSLIQLSTPDAMRGRVSAVSSIFISASNELGEFRGGVMARTVNAVPSVVIGGALACGIAFAWMFLFPILRKADGWEDAEQVASKTAPADAEAIAEKSA